MAEEQSNTQILEELEELSHNLYQSHTSRARRTASLALPRSLIPHVTSDDTRTTKIVEKSNTKPLSRRLSLSPWHSRPKPNTENEQKDSRTVINPTEIKKLDEATYATEKKGIWSWRPIRALSHIGKQKLSCLFSVEVITVQDLPTAMDGLRLSVCFRKKESKEGAVHTMPARVSQGTADFEETLFSKCRVYYTPGTFEPRPFWIYVFAIDAEELDFGKGSVDLSQLIKESVDRSSEGTRIRQWDVSFSLSGKAKGGELVLKLGFQVMDKDGGIGLYSQPEGSKSTKSKEPSSPFARKQSKNAFSVLSPRMSSRPGAWTPSKTQAASELQGVDELDLNEPAPVASSSSSVQKAEEPEAELKIEDKDTDFPDFEVVDKGVEVQDSNEYEKIESEERSESSEVVKEVVHDQVHLTRLTELDSIAQQIKALESMMGEDKMEEETAVQRLDADEETITREFLQLLEDDEGNEFNLNQPEPTQLKLEDVYDGSAEGECKAYLSDLGKGLGCVVQTRNGGYLAAMNPLNNEVSRREAPKLAMQLSKPMVIPLDKSLTGFELFQMIAAMKLDELTSQIICSMPLDELQGKTSEQIAFEGIAASIIQGRNKEGASSSAARTITAVKFMSTSMITGRKERISTGLWNINESPVAVENMLASSLPKIEAMTVEAMKIQAEMAEEEAPFDVSPVTSKENKHLLKSAEPLEDWIKDHNLSETITQAVVVQLRDTMRRYEAVGGPVVALIQAKRVDEERYKVMSVHVGGLKVMKGGKRSVWDSERQRLTAKQWLVAYGLGKVGEKGKFELAKEMDFMWSISSRVVADMWLKSMRNPDIKLVN